jgi:maleate isomerase
MRNNTLTIEPRYSNKFRIGLIVPSLNVTIEPEFNAITPKSISIHATRLLLESGEKRSLEKMAKRTEEACDLLASAKVDAIAYACTTGSLVKGSEWETDLIRRMKSRVSVPVITTAGAVVNALKTMGLEKVGLGTPYTDTLNEIEVDFLESNGIHVTRVKGLGCITGEDLHKYSSGETRRLARQVNSEDAQGIFLSCTDLKTVTVIASLEKELQKPVVSSNVATLWKTLKALKYKGKKIRGCGSLLERI